MQRTTVGPLLRAILVGAVAFGLVSATGCATPDGDVGATFDPLIAFPATAVWDWDDARNKLPDDDRLDPSDLDRTIKSAVAAEFAAKAYNQTSASEVQYHLSYELSIHTWTSQTVARAFGTLSVLMTDAASGRRAWLGFVRMQIDRSLTPAQRDERLRNIIARMLKDFPPAQPE